MSLETGASLITLSLLLNKISGLYGLLALLTGYHLSPVQLSMYLYSLVALFLTAVLFPHIRKQSPLQCLALAWLYLIDSVINAAYTAAFGVTWFLVISQTYAAGSASAPGKETIEQTAGFTNPKYEDATAAAAAAADGAGGLRSAFNQPESFQSIFFICLLWIVRSYFVLVMLAFARQAIRLYIVSPRHTAIPTHSRNTSIASVADIDRDLFSPYTPEGHGWKGQLGRVMINVGRSYWLGEDESSDSWMSVANRKFRGHAADNVEHSGPTERERRRRSGTGPPQPPLSILQNPGRQPTILEEAPGTNVKLQPWPEV